MTEHARIRLVGDFHAPGSYPQRFGKPRSYADAVTGQVTVRNLPPGIYKLQNVCTNFASFGAAFVVGKEAELGFNWLIPVGAPTLETVNGEYLPWNGEAVYVEVRAEEVIEFWAPTTLESLKVVRVGETPSTDRIIGRV